MNDHHHIDSSCQYASSVPCFPRFPFLCSAKVWDAITGSDLHTFVHSHIVKTVEFAPDSRRFVSGGHEVRLFLH